MLYEITYYQRPPRCDDLHEHWIVVVQRNRMPIAWVFRKSEAEARAWAEKNIYVYARGKTPAYG